MTPVIKPRVETASSPCRLLAVTAICRVIASESEAISVVTDPVLTVRFAPLACHNAIWELAERLIATEVNPDELSHNALAGELTNHLIAGVVLTPGISGTLAELQRAGFNYANSG